MINLENGKQPQNLSEDLARNPFKQARFSGALSPQETPSISAEEIKQGLSNPWVAKLLENYFSGGEHTVCITPDMSPDEVGDAMAQRRLAVAFLRKIGVHDPRPAEVAPKRKY